MDGIFLVPFLAEELTDRGLRYTKEEMGGHFQTLMDDMVRRGIVP